MHVGQLRKEFDDLLFTRTSSGLAFTPGGLRLASRAVEILGLQDRTVREVSQAGARPSGAAGRDVEPVRRARRPGTDRAVREPRQRPRGRAERALRRGVPGPARHPHRRRGDRAGAEQAGRHAQSSSRSCSTRCGPSPARTTRSPGARLTSEQIRRQSWNLGPSGRRGRRGGARDAARPRRTRAAAADLPEPRRRGRGDHRGNGVALAVGFSVSRRPVRRAGWSPSRVRACAPRDAGRRSPSPRSTRRRPPPSCCGSSPRRGRPRRWSAAPACTWAGSSRRCTSPSGADLGRSRRRRRAGRAACAPAGTRRSTAAPPPSSRPAARSRSAAARGFSQTTRRAPPARPGHGGGQLLGWVAVPAVRGDHQDAAADRRCRAATGAARSGSGRGGCRRTGRRPAPRPARPPPPASAVRAPA